MAEILTKRFLPDAQAIGATRSVITRADFLGALDLGECSPYPSFGEFVDRVRADVDDLMVQLKWWPA